MGGVTPNDAICVESIPLIASGCICPQDREGTMPAYSTISSRVSVALLLYSLVSCNPSIAASHIHVCPNTPVSVAAGESADTPAVCKGAEDALEFFDRLNLQPSRPLVVEIVKNMPSGVSRTAVGCFLEEHERILVLTFSAFQNR